MLKQKKTLQHPVYCIILKTFLNQISKNLNSNYYEKITLFIVIYCIEF